MIENVQDMVTDNNRMLKGREEIAWIMGASQIDLKASVIHLPIRMKHYSHGTMVSG